jgi:hypothetical protein
MISKETNVKKSKVLNTAEHNAIAFVICVPGREDKDGDGDRGFRRVE